MKQQEHPGIFITVEGIEGVVKSTAMQWIAQSCEAAGYPVRKTREPGGSIIAEAIRQVLLQHYAEPMLPDTELLLMFAARADHLAKVILPHLAQGYAVISDRFTDASYAYQGFGRGIPFSRIEILEDWVQKTLRPDLTLLLDAPAEIALQ